MFSMNGLQVVLLDTTLSYLNWDDVEKLRQAANEFPELPTEYLPINWKTLSVKATNSKLPEVDNLVKLKKAALSDYLYVAQIRQAISPGGYSQSAITSFKADLTQLNFWKMSEKQPKVEEVKFDLAQSNWSKLLPAFSAHHEKLMQSRQEEIAKIDPIKRKQKEHQLQNETALVVTCNPDITRPYCNQLQLGSLTMDRYEIEFFMIAKPESSLTDLCNMLMDVSNFPAYSLMQLKWNGEIRNLPSFGNGFFILKPIFYHYSILNYADSFRAIKKYPTRLTDSFSLLVSDHPDIDPAKNGWDFLEVTCPAGFSLTPEYISHLHFSTRLPSCKKIEEYEEQETHCSFHKNPFQEKEYGEAYQHGKLNSFLFNKTLNYFYQALLQIAQTQSEYLKLSLTVKGIQLDFKETVNAPEFHRCQAAAVRYLLKEFTDDASNQSLTIPLKKNSSGEFNAGYLLKILNHVMHRLLSQILKSFENETWFQENLTDSNKGATHSRQQLAPIILSDGSKEYQIQTCWMYDGLLIEVISDNPKHITLVQNYLNKIFEDNFELRDRFIFIKLPLEQILKRIDDESFFYQSNIYIGPEGDVLLAARRHQGYAGQNGLCTPGGYNPNPWSSILATRDKEFGANSFVTIIMRRVIKDKTFPKTIYSVLPAPSLQEIKLDTAEFVIGSALFIPFYQLGNLDKEQLTSLQALFKMNAETYRIHFGKAAPLRPVKSIFTYLKNMETLLSEQLGHSVKICMEYEVVWVDEKEYWKPHEKFGEIRINLAPNSDLNACLENLRGILSECKTAQLETSENSILVKCINPELLLRKLKKHFAPVVGLSQAELLKQIKSFNPKKLGNILENFKQIQHFFSDKQMIEEFHYLILKSQNASNPIEFAINIGDVNLLKKLLEIFNLKVTQEYLMFGLEKSNVNMFVALVLLNRGFAPEQITQCSKYSEFDRLHCSYYFIIAFFEMKKNGISSQDVLQEFDWFRKKNFLGFRMEILSHLDVGMPSLNEITNKLLPLIGSKKIIEDILVDLAQLAKKPIKFAQNLNDPSILQKILETGKLTVTHQDLYEPLIERRDLNLFIKLTLFKYGCRSLEKVAEYPKLLQDESNHTYLFLNFILTLIEMKKQSVYHPDVLHEFLTIFKNKSDSRHKHIELDMLIQTFQKLFDESTYELSISFLELLTQKLFASSVLYLSIKGKYEWIVRECLKPKSPFKEVNLFEHAEKKSSQSYMGMLSGFNSLERLSEYIASPDSLLHCALVSTPNIAKLILERCEPQHFWVTSKNLTPLFCAAWSALYHESEEIFLNLKLAIMRIKSIAKEMKEFIHHNEENIQQILMHEYEYSGDVRRPLLHQIIYSYAKKPEYLDKDVSSGIIELVDVFSNAVLLSDCNYDNLLHLIVGPLGIYIPGLVSRIISQHKGILDCVNQEGSTPLHYVFEHPVNCSNYAKSRVSIADEILSANPDINKQNDAGNTPLHLLLMNEVMIKKENLEITIQLVKTLVSRGADLSLTNKKGKKPVFFAEKSGNQEIFDLCQQLSIQQRDLPAAKVLSQTSFLTKTPLEEKNQFANNQVNSSSRYKYRKNKPPPATEPLLVSSKSYIKREMDTEKATQNFKCYGFH